MNLVACLSIDLDWTRRRHPAMVHSRFIEAAADPSRRRKILADLSADFSPYLSLDRLTRQFPDYDFSVGDELRKFLVARCSADTYCSPHWLYDDKFYRLEHLDIDAALRRGENDLGFFHFLVYGMHEGRRAHRLFDPSWYAKNCCNIGANQTFADFVTAGVFEDLPTSALFDPEFYRTLHPEVRTEILKGRYSCSLEHFIAEGAARRLVPSADWDGEFYLKCNPDVAEGLAAGLYPSPFNHWLEHGLRESVPQSIFRWKILSRRLPRGRRRNPGQTAPRRLRTLRQSGTGAGLARPHPAPHRASARGVFQGALRETLPPLGISRARRQEDRFPA